LRAGILAAGMAVCLAGTASGVRAPIVLDGAFGDWDGLAPAAVDPSGDGAGSIDLGRLWCADDDRFLFIRFEVGPAEVQLDSGNDLVLYLDTDLDGATGRAIGGIGAELEWRFGARRGTFYNGARETPIRHADIRFIAAPSVTSTTFEMAIARDARPDGVHPLFTGSRVRILLMDGASGDREPNSGEVLTYTFDEGTLPPETQIPIARASAGDLRVTTHNVHNDGPWDAAKEPGFRRQYAALAPGILNFQEIYDHSAPETAALVETWLPSGQGQTRYGAGVSGHDCITVSRYPVEGIWPIDGNMAVLLNTSAALGTKLLIVNAHLPCCTDDPGRQREVDHILSFIRDAGEPGGVLPANTPVVIVGDLNLVGLSRQLKSLLTGDILDNATYGPDFHPDWDGSDLADLISRQTERRVAFTWQSEGGDYWPGRLDFLIATGSVLETANHFVLYTPEMSADSLAAHGLLAHDSLSSDHLILTADFRASGSADSTGAGTPAAIQARLVPNPSRGTVELRLELPREAAVLVEICDPAGRRVAYPAGPAWVAVQAGEMRLSWDGRDDPAGAYFVRVRVRDLSGENARTVKWLSVR